MLKVENLCVKYAPTDARYALEQISFSLAPGERVALLGANGAGKSTLLLALAGVLPAESGSVSVGGLPLQKNNLAQIRQMLGLVFQNPDDQLFMPTVYEDVAFGPRNYGTAEPQVAAKVNSALAALGIEHLSGRMPHQLSGGEKRLAALAGVMALEPQLLLLDEPSSFLDPRAGRKLIGTLQALPQAMLVATHDIRMAEALCDRALIFSEGRLLAGGMMKDILQNTELLLQSGL